MIRLVAAGLAVILFGSPLIGLFSQAWAPVWFGQQQMLPIPVGTPMVIPIPGATPVPTITPPGLLNVVDVAMTWLGVPYLWGGCTRHGVDCSCLMQLAFREVGIQMPRITVDQIRWATPISAEQAVAGDLVFYDNTCSGCGANPTHVGMVISHGMMIDAGDPVKVEPIFSGHNARYGRVHL